MGKQMQELTPIIWETWVRSLSWEDPLEKEMAAHASILAWEIPRSEEPGGGSKGSMGSQRVRRPLETNNSKGDEKRGRDGIHQYVGWGRSAWART